MRLLVCEWVTGGGFAGQVVPESLLCEGELMAGSLVRDLADAGGDLQLAVCRDARLPAPGWPCKLVPVAEGDDFWQVWADAVTTADAVWPVAPETGGALLRLTALVAAEGKVLLGSRPEAIRLCASKLATATLLAAQGIPTVPTRRLEAGPPGATAGWVVKPDDGAGAEDTRWIKDRGALDAFSGPEWIVQPYLRGDAASLSLLCRDGIAALLACNRQHVALDPSPFPPGARSFRYRGWTVGALEGRRGAYDALASAVASAIPALWGYVGIDLIETAAGPVILEINPRLTTTYAGLRDAIGQNPAALVLALASGGPLPTIGVVRPVEVEL